MNKLKTSLTKALLFVFFLHLIPFLGLYFTNNFDEKSFLHALPISISIFLIPSFLSFLFFNKKKKKIIDLLKPSILSFIIINLIVFLFFRFIKKEDEFTLLNSTSILNSSVAFFVALFFTLIQKIKLNSKLINQYNLKELNFSLKTIFIISFSGVLVYSILILISNRHLQDVFMVFYKFLPIGFILSLITIHFFNYIFVKYKQSQRIYYIVVYYIVSISIIVFWVVISFNNFGILKEGIGAAIARAFLLSSIILYAPYFLYVIIFTHLYFLSLVNKFEKQLLKQQSLETQLNYQQLKNQLSPHFLFNNINVLTSLIEEDSKKAVEFSEKLSNIYRYFLEQEKQDVVVLRDELTFTKDYLELLQTRFENGLEFNISINKEYQNKFIVSTTLQQVLENVVKHNEISAEFPVTIRMYILDDYLVIENDIKPKLSEVKSSLNGIRNIKLRYSFFTDKKVLINQTKDFYKIKIPLLTV